MISGEKWLMFTKHSRTDTGLSHSPLTLCWHADICLCVIKACVSLATVRGEQASGFEKPPAFPDFVPSPSQKKVGDATIRILNAALEPHVLKLPWHH